MRNFVQPGDTITLLAPRTLATPGLGVLVGVIFAVATEPAASGAAVECVFEGIFDLPKASGAWTQGAVLYWDNTAFNVTTTSSANTKIGAAYVAQASGDTVGRVMVTGQV